MFCLALALGLSLFLFLFSVQVPFLVVDKLDDDELSATVNAVVTLDCIADFSQQRPPVYKWSRDGKVLGETSSSLTITYRSATDINKNYHCARNSPSNREVQCISTYQCTASLPGTQVTDGTKANVTVTLRK